MRAVADPGIFNREGGAILRISGSFTLKKSYIWPVIGAPPSKSVPGLVICSC